MAKKEEPAEDLPENGDVSANVNIDDDALLASKKKKKKLIIIVAIVLILVAVGAGLFFSGVLGGHSKAEPQKQAAGAKITEEAAFFDAPDMVINITDAGGRQRFLKLSLSLELAQAADEPALKVVMPRVTDQFQTYLRELKVEDLRGSAGIYRLRQELLSRVRTAAKPVDVRDVLFREILVQ